MKPDPEASADQVLLQDILQGNLGAFDALVRRHQGAVFRFLFHFLGGNAADAEDLTQETFLMIHRKLAQHNPAQSFRAWMMTIARNLAISQRRRNVPTPLDPSVLAGTIRAAADQSASSVTQAGSWPSLAGACPSPEREILMREASAQVHAALARLSEAHREILVMRYLLDAPLHEVAEMLNIPEGTAKSRLFAARRELREMLERSDATPAFPPTGLSAS